MRVTKDNFSEILLKLKEKEELSLDTETTGLRPYHGDRLFSIIIFDGEEAYYYNFQDYPNVEALPREYIKALEKNLFQLDKISWYLHNAKFDLHMLHQEGVFISGKIYCTEVGARLEYNEHFSYSLGECAKRIGEAKDDAVEEFILANKLWEWRKIPGKDKRDRDKFYTKVPFDIISKYGEQDARVTYYLAKTQKASLQKYEAHGVNPFFIRDNEASLTKVCFDMEREGVLVDTNYCLEAISYFESELINQKNIFKERTGLEFVDSAKVLSEAFKGFGIPPTLTEKGNPSFDGDVLKAMKNDLANLVLSYRDIKSRLNFFHTFLYEADNQDRIHPNMRQAGTNSGRFSYNNPNLQNLTDDSENEGVLYPIRKAFSAPKDYMILSMDFDQLEYRLMLDYAGEEELVSQVKAGLDVHEATAKMMGVGRKYAKTLNFGLLYGQGAEELANSLGVTINEAKALKEKYFSTLPGVKSFIRRVMKTAEGTGFIFNRFGRIYQLNDTNYAYKMPNRLIQGTGGDTTKIAMVKLHNYLWGKKSRMILNVHDEIDFYIHKTELHIIPKLKEITEKVYPYKSLPLTVSLSYSWDNLFDLKEWGDGSEARDSVPKKGSTKA